MGHNKEKRIVKLINDARFFELYKTLVIKPFLHYKMTKEINYKQIISNDFIFFDDCFDIIIKELERRNGYIYILDNKINNYYKVGMTRKMVHQRLKTLNSSGVFYDLENIRYFKVKDVFLEKVIHKDLLSIGGRNNKHKEFFNLPLNLIEHVIQDNIYLFNDFLNKIKIR